jgi:hypothetical protein
MRKALSVLAALALGVAGFTAPAQAAPAVPITAPAAAAPSDAPPPKAMPDRQGRIVVPGSSDTARSALATYYYQYTRDVIDPANDGVSWDMNVQSPWKSSLENHTLAQVAVCQDNIDDCIEFGWIKAESSTSCPAGNTAVCMFAGVRVNNTFLGYNGSGSGWVDDPANTTIHRQISLNGAVGGQRHWQVIHNATDAQWEVWYGTGPNGSTWKQRVGWFPDSLWGGTFTRADYVQFYTEVVSDQRVQSAQCTDAGTNVTPTTTAGFRFNNITLINPASTQTMAVNDVVPSGLTGRGSIKISDSESRNGGPGGC